MSTLDAKMEKVHAAVDEFVAELEKDQQIDDAELRRINDLLEEIEQKFINLLDKYGLEIGDERHD